MRNTVLHVHDNNLGILSAPQPIYQSYICQWVYCIMHYETMNEWKWMPATTNEWKWVQTSTNEHEQVEMSPSKHEQVQMKANESQRARTSGNTKVGGCKWVWTCTEGSDGAWKSRGTVGWIASRVHSIDKNKWEWIKTHKNKHIPAAENRQARMCADERKRMADVSAYEE